jgi:two-component system response regulator MprA
MSRILVVEDSRTQALRLKLELVRNGYDVDIATNGNAGLEAALADVPAAIILDVDLPGLDGYSLCRELKTSPSTADIPILMLTHRDKAADTMAGLESGADDYIPKDEFAEGNVVAALRSLGLI